MKRICLAVTLCLAVCSVASAMRIAGELTVQKIWFPDGTYLNTGVEVPDNVSFSSESSSGAWNVGTGYVPVILSTVPSETVTVSYTASDITATDYDYTCADGVVTFGVGVTTSDIAITVHEVYRAENVTLRLSLISATGATIVSPTGHTYTITAGGTPPGPEAKGSGSVETWDETGGWDDAISGSDYTGDAIVVGDTMTFTSGALDGQSFSITNVVSDGTPDGAFNIEIPEGSIGGADILNDTFDIYPGE